MYLESTKNIWGFHPLQEAYYLQLKEENSLLTPARVIFASHETFRIKMMDSELEVDAKVRGQFYHEGKDWPVVGDWVLIEQQSVDHQFWPIEDVLPRRSSLKRIVQGKSQVLASNIDYIAIVTSFNMDLNERRIERALAMIEESGALPLIVVNKSDLVDHESELQILQNLRKRFSQISIFSCSAENEIGHRDLIHFFKAGQTLAFLGMSGVGKSTLVNRILESPLLKTQAIRELDSRGRHTTTHREMFLTDYHFWVIDSPGIREFSFAGSEEHLDSAFEDITSFFSACRFRDCAHDNEPDCAVQKALEDEVVSVDRWKNYLKIKREVEFHENKTNKKNRRLTLKKLKS